MQHLELLFQKAYRLTLLPTHRDVDQTIAFGQECELVAVAVRDDGSDPGVARLIILFKVLLVEVVE